MTSSIMTLTLNPAIDETVYLDDLTIGNVHRANLVRYDAGGKGINVAACLGAYSIPVAATGFLGDENLTIFENFFAARHVDDRFIRLKGATRTNVKILTPNETTDINLPGLAPGKLELNQLNTKLHEENTGYLVLAGSLPPSCPQDIYADLVAAQHARHHFSIVDCSGAALNAVLSAPYLPMVVKPNIAELSEWAGYKLNSMDEILAEGFKLQQSGVSLVVISMGSEGALFISRHGAIHASIKIENIASTVGAGDAMVAGIVASLVDHADLEATARLATAFAAGKLMLTGADLPERSVISQFSREVTCRIL
ncbi:1-phosphofructokinase family hexose kinase [Bartonella sp. HY761]|uniref:1-phosphofructokinase family hexose kinase n=1 Tax=Bartonella sp. HY761 TaxID=2979330 RepID=UPI00220713E6|nr:1-phosphofructokinase family hexose kinase [Bartonella sp. HY761]UXN05627.1 1-phosphofructokinase family hexose kinase [Bartonella sp. HY761]